jgi:hypothetical protein
MVVSTTTRADLPVQAPKKNRDHVGDSKMSPYMQDRYLRAEAANDNGVVGLPFFAAAVVSGVTRWLYLDSVFGLGRGGGLHSASLHPAKLLSLGPGEARSGTSVHAFCCGDCARAGTVADTTCRSQATSPVCPKPR